MGHDQTLLRHLEIQGTHRGQQLLHSSLGWLLHARGQCVQTHGWECDAGKWPAAAARQARLTSDCVVCEVVQPCVVLWRPLLAVIRARLVARRYLQAHAWATTRQVLQLAAANAGCLLGGHTGAVTWTPLQSNSPHTLWGLQSGGS